MERIRTMTDARKHASLWAATALLAVILLFLCGGKVFAQENSLDIEVTEIVNGRPPQVQKEGTPLGLNKNCLLYTSPSPRDLSTSRMPSSA